MVVCIWITTPIPCKMLPLHWIQWRFLSADAVWVVPCILALSLCPLLCSPDTLIGIFMRMHSVSLWCSGNQSCTAALEPFWLWQGASSQMELHVLVLINDDTDPVILWMFAVFAGPLSIMHQWNMSDDGLPSLPITQRLVSTFVSFPALLIMSPLHLSVLTDLAFPPLLHPYALFLALAQ